MENLIICKQNELIENFIFNATEMELQILNYAVAITNPHWDNKSLVYEITIPELVATYKTKSKSAYEEYKHALERLMKRTYSYYDVNRKKHTENLVTRITEDMDNESWLSFRFNEYISTRISNLQGLFTKYDIKHIAMFKSRYAFLLYEYFKMNLQQSQSKVFNVKFSIESFKEKLDILDKYDLFFNLEKKVLKISQNNINKHSDIRISYVVNRKGRTPVSITFKAQYKKEFENKQIEFQHELNIPEPQPELEKDCDLGKEKVKGIKEMLGYKI